MQIDRANNLRIIESGLISALTYDKVVNKLTDTMGKVATLVNRCLREDQHLCDVADDLNSSIMVKMDVLPNEEKANQATSLAILKGFV